MKICITAANCFIGLPLVKKVSSLGWNLVAVVREGCQQRDSVSEISNVQVVELNLEDYANLGEKVGSVDCAVLLTWNGTRGKARLDEFLQESNFKYNMEAVKSLISSGCKRIITAGSQAEYGLYNEMVTEDTPCKPVTAYGKYKLKFYKEAFNYCKGKGVTFIELRFFSLYGPGDYENTMIMSSIRNMMNNQPCDFTEATQIWDYLYIDDAVEALSILCKKKCDDGAYNIGSGDSRQLKKYIEEQKRILKSKSELRFGTIPYGAAGIVSISPCIDKLQKEINWKPKISFKDGIISIAGTILKKS